MRFYAGQAMNDMADVKDLFVPGCIRTGYVEMADVLKLVEAEDGEGLLAVVNWVGFEEDEPTWEPIDNIRSSWGKYSGNAPKRAGSIAFVAPAWN